MSDFEYNKDYNIRDNLIFGKTFDWENPESDKEVNRNNFRGRILGGICHFDKLDFSTLGFLIKEHFVDPEENQNNSLTIEEFYEFMMEWDDKANIFAHGYVVSPLRKDYRISIEGIQVDPFIKGVKGETFDKKFILDFVDLFRFADEFKLTETEAFCWYD